MLKKSYFLGCDVSKGYSDFVILNHKKEIALSNFQLDDTPKGHQELYGILKAFCETHPAAHIYAAVESTGGYENNWYHFFWQQQGCLNLKVARLNPLGVKKHKEASMERMDTDKISARKIAEYLISYPEKVVYNSEDYFAPLRRHWKFVRLLKKQHTQLLNQLESLLYVAQPQILKFCSEEVHDWTLLMLVKFPTARRLAHAKVNELKAIPYLSLERSKELIREAKISVASSTQPEIETIIRSTAQQILNLRKTIAQQVKEMIKSYDLPEIEILTSFKGIGEFSAFGLLIEIGSLERFPSVKHLASFFGLHPVYKESGDGKWKMSMSKKGRKDPRWILFNVTMSAIPSNEMIKELYEEYQARGFCKMAAIGILMHKILRIIYGMLKHKKKYDPEIDRNYRKRSKIKQKEKINVQQGKERQYQGYDEDAPVSYRQRKKREQHKAEVRK